MPWRCSNPLVSLPGLFDLRALRIPRLYAHIFRDISKIPRKQSYTCIIPYACLLETNLKVGNKLRIYEIENNISVLWFLSLAHSLIRTRASPHSLSPEFAMPPSHLENVSYLIPYTQRRTRPTTVANAFSTLSSLKKILTSLENWEIACLP